MDPVTVSLILSVVGILISGIHLGHRTITSSCWGAKVEIREAERENKKTVNNFNIVDK